MTKSLWRQLFILALLSVVVGLGNNLRPSVHIDWVRDWTPYSQLLPKDKTTPEQPLDESPESVSPESVERPEDKRATVPEMIVANQGITDIDLKTAHDIHTYAPELTLWIDARNPELYAAGHITGSHLLDFYDQDSYLGEVGAQIEERGPVALVIYCKGKDCTDSHHLAEDLQAKLGWSNIFVYKAGFDDWFQAGYPISGTLAEDGSPPATADSSTEVDPALQAAMAEKVLANQGITDIDLETAKNLFKYAPELTFWIDARDPELYAEGHIKGAHLLHFYDQESHRDDVAAKVAAAMPEALVIYCKGKECTDSHHLAQDLFGKDLGGMSFANIFVYKDGFDDWYAAGLPIEGSLAEAEVSEGTTAVVRDKPEEKPPGMYLEHVLRDMIPFIFGMFLLASWRRRADKRGWVITAAIFVGAFFIWAALPKLGNPLEFAKNIWNYDLAPGEIINLSAMVLPGLELVCGLALITGLMRRGSGFIVSALLVVFIVAVSYNVVRGHEFNCGCTSTTTMFTDLYLKGWNDKYLLILRDIGLLVMSWMAFRFKPAS